MITKKDSNILKFYFTKRIVQVVDTCEGWHWGMPEFASVTCIMHMSATSSIPTNYLSYTLYLVITYQAT